MRIKVVALDRKRLTTTPRNDRVRVAALHDGTSSEGGRQLGAVGVMADSGTE
jgi:hypothetical protein